MKWSHHKFLIPGIGLILVIAGFVMVQTRAHIEYPMHVWRMDLDDALVGVGTILLGAAAIWTVWLKAKEASDKAEAISHRINGGLSSLASQIMMDEIKQSGIDTQLANRVACLETKITEVKDERDDCKEKLAQQDSMIQAIHDRLDDSGFGRQESR
jgi:hypothetical protein